MSIKYKVGIQIEGGALTVSGGSITLGGTGRIQGVDSVSVNTDAANKLYVDTQVATKDSYSQWKVQADSGSIFNVTSNTNVDFIGGTNITTSTGTQAGGLVVTINNGINNNNQLTNGAGYTTNTGTTTASNTQTFTNKSGNISQWTNNSGYITSASLPTVSNATITLAAGTGLSGGGAITLNQSGNETVTFNNTITNNNQLSNGRGFIGIGSVAITSNGSTPSLGSGISAAEIRSLIGAGTSSSTGTVTSIATSTGLSGGTITTSGTLTNTDRGSQQNIFKNFTASSGGTATANINNDTLTIAGGSNVSTVRSGDTITINATDTNTNNYLTGLSWATGTGVLSATRQGLSTLSVDLDGRYVTSSGVTSIATSTGLSGGTITSTGTLTNTDRGSQQSIFKNIAVSGQNTVIADNNNDTLTLVAAGGMTITTNSATDTITFNPNDDNSNNFVTGGNVTSGTVTLNRSGLSNVSFAINNSQITNGAGYITAGSLPSVGNGTLTVTGGTGMSGSGTFTANQSGNTTITLNNSITNNNQLTNGRNFTVSGSNISQFANNSGYITSSGSISGNAATSTKFSTGRTNYKGVTDTSVIGQMMWKHYGNNHTIFDASNGTSPSGTSISNTSPGASWTGTYPTLMGWNGSTTYGVRVDVSANAEQFKNARTIAGVSFNGTANISLNNNAITNGAGYITSASLPSVGNGTFSVTGNTGLSGSGSMTANQSGNTSATLTNTDRGSSQAIFKNFSASSGGTATANSNNDTLTIAAGSNITTVRSGDTITINAISDGQGVTSVATGGGLTGGTITSTGTLSHANTSSQGNVNNSGNTYIQDVTLDTYGHVTSLTSGTTTLATLGYTGATNANNITNNNQLTNGAGYVTSSGGSMSTWNITADSGGSESISQNETVDIAGGTNISTSRSGSTITITNGITNNTQIANGRGYSTTTGTVTSVSSSIDGSALSVGVANATSTPAVNFDWQGSSTEYVNGEGGLVTFPSIPQGDITAVVAGNKMTGGGTSGSVSIGLASNNISQFVNNSGYTTNVGDITGVTAGTGMSGGGTSGSVTLNCTITNNNQLTNGAGYITSAGTRVTSIATTAPILGGTITSTGTLSLRSPVSGNWHNGGAPVVGGDGLMEIGRYIDFHTSNTSTSDFDVRLNATSGLLTVSGSVSSTGNIQAVGNLTGADVYINDQIIKLGDTNTYLQFNAADTWRVVTGGTQRFQVSNSLVKVNNVFEVADTNGDKSLTINPFDGSFSIGDLDAITGEAQIVSDNSNIFFNTGGNTRMRIKNNGGIGMGTDPSTGVKLQVQGVILGRQSNGVADFYLGNYGFNRFIRFHVNNIDTYFDMNCGDIFWRQGSSNRFRMSMSTGSFIASGAITAFGSPSDERLKENIKPIESALDKAMKLQGVTFNWKEQDEANIKEDIGFIAQDVKKVLPELVREEADGMLSMRHQGITPILLEAIKELKAEIEELKKIINK